MSKMLLQHISGGGGSSRMDAGVLGVCINEDQPVGTLEVDCMVHCTLLHGYSGSIQEWLAELALMLCTGSASMAEVHSVCDNPWPIDYHAC